MTRSWQRSLRPLGCLMIVLLAGLYGGSALGQELKKTLKKPDGAITKEARPPAREQEIKIFSLQYADVEQTAQLLRGIMAQQPEVPISIGPDKRTNSIIAQGPAESLRVMEAIVRRLDEPAPEPTRRPAPKPIRIRIIWLAEGLPETEGSAPADDLKGVAEELARVGVKNVRQVAQMMVMTQSDGKPEGKFQLSCTPLLDGAPAMFTAGGKVSIEQGVGNLQIGLSANRQTPPGEPFTRGRRNPAATLVDLELDTVVRPSQYAVLGVAPVGKITSIFVIQVIPGEGK